MPNQIMPNQKLRPAELKRYVVTLVLAWTVILALLATNEIYQIRETSRYLARGEANVHFEWMRVFRLWVSSHGGVYVPTDDRTPPNKHLANVVDERDLVTPNGKALTLVNPAYMTRQVFEEYEDELGIKGHMTSLDPLRPENEADDWELSTLKSFQNGRRERLELAYIGDTPYLRSMRPLHVKEPCLKCHEQQMYKIGEVRGGIGVSIPLTKYFSMENRKIAEQMAIFAGLWLLGIAAILIGKRGIYNEISARKATEVALLKSEDNLSKAQSIAHIGSWNWDIVGNSVEWSDEIYKIFGMEKNKFGATYESFINAVHPDDRDFVESHMNRAVNENMPYNIEHRIVTPCGSTRVVHEQGEIIYDSSHKPRNMIGTTQDITERKKAEEELHKSEQKMLIHVEQTPLGVIEWDTDFLVVEWNPAAEQIFGYKREEAIGKQASDLILPEQAIDNVKEIWGSLLQQRGGGRSRNENVTKGGEAITCEWYNTPLVDKDGEVIGVTSLVDNITEKVNAEMELHRLFTAIEQAGETVVITDTSGSIQYVNPAFEATTGFSQKEAIGKTPRMLKSGKHSESFYSDMWGTLMRGEMWRGNIINKKKSGDLFEEHATISSIYGDSGEIVGYVAVKHDITREVTLEKQLRQAQKMQAIGTLAGGIAHDFNNILSAILGYSSLASDDMPEKSEAKENIDEVIKAGRRAKDLVRQILAFSRQTEMELKPLQLHLVIKEAIKLLKVSIPLDIELLQNIVTANDVVMADPTQVHQVLMNLCTNAIHAMRDGGGILSINLEPIDVDMDFAETYPPLKEGAYVLLSVGDTGHGMDATTMERILEPFFTTKEVGDGTGMGLAAVHGIMEKHNGVILVQSSPKQGARFDAYFPRSDIESDVGVDEELPMQRGNEKIMVVDDEASIAELAERILKKAGYDVESYSSSKKALSRFLEAPDRFDLIITDEAMPEMTGAELAKEVMKTRSDISVIIMTGFAKTAPLDALKDIEVNGFIFKPFTPKELGKIVRRTLNPDN